MRFSALPILKARARRAVILAYDVDPGPVASFIPQALTPDTWEGRAYVLIIGVEFATVRLFGVTGVGIKRMPVVEFCCPVQEAPPSSERRGILPLQTVVPRRFLAWGGRYLAGTPVDVVPMQPVYTAGQETIEMTYRFDWKGREQRIRTICGAPGAEPEDGTLAAFLLRRNWRYGSRRPGALVRTRVEGPFGSVHPIDENHVTVDWGAVIGEPLNPLEDRSPTSAWYDRGGAFSMFWPTSVG